MCRRYLIVLDDIWSIEAWDKVKTFFPNNNDGSAIILTTRLSNLAFQLGDSCHEMSFLDGDKSWNLFCKSVFGEESCPQELEGIGKNIVENCKGLPLSIVVVGGLLAKSKQTLEYWLYIDGNLNSIVNLENDEHCLKILSLSYKELPVHLKPCFLYMGVYPEDCVINVPKLMRLWIAEGFLKPVGGKCLEAVANEYFNDLLGRNLILVNDKGYFGETIKCKVHDLLVDVRVREAKKYKFLYVVRHHGFNNLQDLNIQRRIVAHDRTLPDVIHTFPSHGSLVRSLKGNSPRSFANLFNSRLLRVYNVSDVIEPYPRMHFPENTCRIVNCRYISGLSIYIPTPNLPSSIFFLWNLQTLDVCNPEFVVATSEIWKMSQLRYVHFNELILLDPSPNGHTNDEGEEDDFVLGNLHTLSRVRNFKFSGEVVKRIPNIKELTVFYESDEDWSSCCLNNLARLISLEYLSIDIYVEELIPSLTFPRSLKELTLENTEFDGEDLGTKIGSLPHLQVLRLIMNSFVGDKWETIEGQFQSLKYLEIKNNYESNLKYWRIESWTHFPCLERLYLYRLKKLKEIPSEIGETLKSIRMYDCSDSAAFSAKEILNEQEGLGNEGIQVKIELEENNPDLESLAAPNFQVVIY